ncbi:MAG: type II secretion system protein [Planctomycetes bacterium]|nr:type II secretion system protein [Planctomycetota bacterium]
MRPAAPGRSGFTLTELLVAIGVIAVLASLVVAVGTGMLARGERTQMESAYQALDQAILAMEESRGQPLVFNRRRSMSDAAMQDGMAFSDLDELPPTFVNEAYIMPRLLALLAANGAAWNSLSAVSPDLLRREEKVWPDGRRTTWNLRDPWGQQVAVVPPGRAATRGEIRRARDAVRAGQRTSSADPLRLGIDLGDDTMDEVSMGVSCTGRRWLFISTGPDRTSGRMGTSGAWQDNVLNYEPVGAQP